jgi:hypothetical protein
MSTAGPLGRVSPSKFDRSPGEGPNNLYNVDPLLDATLHLKTNPASPLIDKRLRRRREVGRRGAVPEVVERVGAPRLRREEDVVCCYAPCR